AEAARIVKARHPELDEETAAAEITIVKDLVWTPEAKQNGFGYMDAEKMRVTRDVITQAYELKVTVPHEELYTNTLLPGERPPGVARAARGGPGRVGSRRPRHRGPPRRLAGRRARLQRPALAAAGALRHRGRRMGAPGLPAGPHRRHALRDPRRLPPGRV